MGRRGRCQRAARRHEGVELNYRFAPDLDAASAAAWLQEMLAPWIDEVDTFEVTDSAPAAPPSLHHPTLAALVSATARPVVAKLGWTDPPFSPNAASRRQTSAPATLNWRTPPTNASPEPHWRAPARSSVSCWAGQRDIYVPAPRRWLRAVPAQGRAGSGPAGRPAGSGPAGTEGLAPCPPAQEGGQFRPVGGVGARPRAGDSADSYGLRQGRLELGLGYACGASRRQEARLGQIGRSPEVKASPAPIVSSTFTWEGPSGRAGRCGESPWLPVRRRSPGPGGAGARPLLGNVRRAGAGVEGFDVLDAGFYDMGAGNQAFDSAPVRGQVVD